jgi:hypothetical protein
VPEETPKAAPVIKSMLAIVGLDDDHVPPAGPYINVSVEFWQIVDGLVIGTGKGLTVKLLVVLQLPTV